MPRPDEQSVVRYSEQLVFWREMRTLSGRQMQASRPFPREGGIHGIFPAWRLTPPAHTPSTGVATSANWQRSAAQLIEKISLDAKVAMLEGRIALLAAKLRQAEAKLNTVLEPPIVMPLTSLAPFPYEVIGQINILIQSTEEGFIASCLDANLGSSGETKAEAFDGVKDRIISTYDRLIDKPDDKLGPGPLRQKRVLLNHIRRL